MFETKNGNRFSDEQLDQVLKIKYERQGKCSTCKGGGWTKDGSSCDCRSSMLWQAELIFSGIPEDYWGFDSTQVSELVMDQVPKVFVAKYVENIENAIKKGLGAVFSGERAGGKTTSMSVIAKAAMLKGYRVKYILAPKLIDLYFRDREKFESMSHPTTDLYLIDEFDKVSFKSGIDGNLQKIADFIVRSIMPNKKSLIVATNLSDEEFDGGVGLKSLFERYCEFIPFINRGAAVQKKATYFDRLTSSNPDINFMGEEFLKEAREFAKNIKRIHKDS